MFGKKKAEKEVKPLPPVPEPNQIKQNIGFVSSSGMRDVGAKAEHSTLPGMPAPSQQQPLIEDDEGIFPEPMPKQAKQLPARVHHKVPEVTSATKPSPPLFIKIDKYRELVQGIKDLRSNALSLRDALDAITDIEKELRNGINITQNALDNFNSIISAIDSGLLRVGAEEDVVEVPKEMDEYVKELYDHVERIKHDLKTIKED